MTQDLFILLCAIVKEVVPEALYLSDEFVAKVAQKMVDLGTVEWKVISKNGGYEVAQLYVGKLGIDGELELPLMGMEIFAKRKEGEPWIRKVA